jgi:hypothetical protein
MRFNPRLDTRQAAAFLTERGYKTSAATLNKRRCVGGGPEFELFGRRPLYTEKALLEWVRGRTTPPLRSTSDPQRTRPARSLPPSKPHKPEPPHFRRVRLRKPVADVSAP